MFPRKMDTGLMSISDLAALARKSEIVHRWDDRPVFNPRVARANVTVMPSDYWIFGCPAAGGNRSTSRQSPIALACQVFRNRIDTPVQQSIVWRAAVAIKKIQTIP